MQVATAGEAKDHIEPQVLGRNMTGTGKRKTHIRVAEIISRNHGKRKVLDSRYSQ